MTLRRNKRAVRRKRTSSTRSDENNQSAPKFPYTTSPGSLRKFLELVPERPKPSKVNTSHMKSWGIRDNNASTIPRVLKEVGLCNSNFEPTAEYEKFMHRQDGSKILGSLIKKTYFQLFEKSKEPYKDSDTDLRNLFNIYSGGAPRTMDLQIQTFKALAAYATFDEDETERMSNFGGISSNKHGSSNAALHIDLHIHLPENKDRRGYEDIFDAMRKALYDTRDHE